MFFIVVAVPGGGTDTKDSIDRGCFLDFCI